MFAKHAELIELLLFDDRGAAAPSQVIPLDSKSHRSYHYWHVFVPDVRPGQVYAYRAHGPFDREVEPVVRTARRPRARAPRD